MLEAKFKDKQAILLLSVGLMLPISALGRPGEDPPEKTPEPVVETIVVTATRSERVATEVPVSTTVLSIDTVRDSSADSMRDVLAAVPGVILLPSDPRTHFPVRNQISMRGVGAGSTLVLLDGVPLNDAFHGAVQWNKVAVENVDQVEVVRGGASSLYGNYAVGGTINVLTRPPKRDSIDLRSGYGSYDTLQLNLGLNYVPSDRTSVTFIYDLYDTDGYIRPIPEIRGPIDIQNYSDSETFSFRTDYTPSERTRLKFRAAYFDSLTSQGTPTSFNNTDILDLSISGHNAVGSDGIVTYSFFSQDESFDFQNVRLDAARTTETFANESFSDVDSFGGSIMWSRSVSASIPSVSVGIDVQNAKGHELRDNYSRGAITDSVDTGGEKEIAGVFGQVSWQATSRLEVLASARVDYWRVHNGFELTTPGGRTEYDSNTSTQLDPRISLRYEIAPKTAIRGSVYRGFTAPELRDLYRTGGSRGAVSLANPSLDPEVMTGGDVGFVTSSGSWSGEANLFWNQVKDRVTDVLLDPGPPVIIIEPQNIGTTESKGLELMGQFRFSRAWSFDAGYVYTDAEVTRNPGDPSLVGNRIPEIPEHYASAALRYRNHRGISGSFRGRSLSKAFSDAQNSGQYQSHVVFDLGLNWQLREGLAVYMMAENIFDEQYIAEVRIDSRRGAPQQIYGGVRLSFAPGR